MTRTLFRIRKVKIVYKQVTDIGADDLPKTLPVRNCSSTWRSTLAFAFLLASFLWTWFDRFLLRGSSSEGSCCSEQHTLTKISHIMYYSTNIYTYLFLQLLTANGKTIVRLIPATMGENKIKKKTRLIIYTCVHLKG